MRIVAAKLPYLAAGGNRSVPMVTDDEQGFLESIDTSVQKFLCWNHKINETKNWLRSRGATSKEYVSNLRKLFHQKTKDYEIELEKVRVNWSEPFVEYYLKHLHHKVIPLILNVCYYCLL